MRPKFSNDEFVIFKNYDRVKNYLLRNNFTQEFRHSKLASAIYTIVGSYDRRRGPGGDFPTIHDNFFIDVPDNHLYWLGIMLEGRIWGVLNVPIPECYITKL